MKKFLRQNYLLILITLIGFIIRIAGIDKLPPSLNWDEVSHGYNAYSILTTGKDEWGSWFPTIFPAFGDYKLPLYIYLTVPSITLFGPNAFSVRLVSVLAGTLAIPTIYFLAKGLIPKGFIKIKGINPIGIGYLAAFTLALLPWHIFISRPALEANLALTLIIAGAGFLIAKKYLPASIFLTLSLHSYNTARIFVPLTLICYFLIYRPKIKLFSATSLILIAGFSLVLSQLLTGEGSARFSQISPLSQKQVYIIGQDRLNSTLPQPLPRLIYNRPVQASKTVLLKYFSHFTPGFIYQTSGAHYQFAVPGINMLTWPVIITFLTGLFYLLKNLKNKTHLFILVLFFLAPVADSLTIDPAHALRSSLMIPFIVIIASIGLLQLTKVGKYSTIILAIFTIALILSTSSYWKVYQADYRTNQASSWQYGYQQAIDYVVKNQHNYARVIISKRYAEPHIFYAFYANIKPQELWPKGDNIRFSQSNWRWTDKIGKVFFVNDWDIPQNLPADSLPLESGSQIPIQNSLLITSPDHVPANTRVLQQINFLDGSAAFIICEFL